LRSRRLTVSRRSIVAVALFAGCVLVSARLHAAVFSADAVKAAFLFRFASFVQWPPDVAGTGPFIIGVVDGDPVADQLDHLLPGMNVRGQPAQVRRITRPDELTDVRILYVGAGAAVRSRAVRAKAATLPILLVTDRDDGFEGGGIINFIEAPRNVRFEVSLIAADRARLTIDSALLAVAARVERRVQNTRACDPCNLYAEMSR
jgi:hypothetical protein